MKELQPLNQNVILDMSAIAAESKTAGGIIIPETAKEKPKFAKVIAVGNIEDVAVVAGDIVYFKQYSGTEMEYDGKKYLVIPYEDLLAKLVETDEI